MLTTESISASLQRIRPYLQQDEGDVEVVRVLEDGIVEVRLTGSCRLCPMSNMTLRAGVERALMFDHKEIKRVEQVG
ncbi:MAG: NifU family protein [Ignavibacteriales bacterium]|nr:NifU family protein [Ignavibacteriales bacterium]